MLGTAEEIIVSAALKFAGGVEGSIVTWRIVIWKITKITECGV